MPDSANLKLIKAVTLDWVSGQYDKIMPHVADDAVYVIARGSLEKLSPLFGTFSGSAAISQWYKENRLVSSKGGVSPFCRLGNLGEFIDAGEQVISFGTMPETAAEPACDWVAIWTLAQGKIIKCWLVMDSAAVSFKLRKANP